MARAVVKGTAAADDLSMRDLLGRIVEDGGKLLGQQFELFRAEVRDELRRAVGAAAQTAAGAEAMKENRAWLKEQRAPAVS
jgi:hypothetical protein